MDRRTVLALAITAVAVALVVAIIASSPGKPNAPPAEEKPERVLKTPAEIEKEADYLVYLNFELEGPMPAEAFLSGVIFEDGGQHYILTAGHYTIPGYKVVRITAHLRKQPLPLEAEIVGFDRRVDVAILKIKSPDFKYTGRLATLGNSSEVSKGDTVVSLGAPFDMRDTISDGKVMNLRQINGFDHIIHNALIAPGNSGGPLLNLYGEVVAINVRIFYGFGIGEAVAINEIKKIFKDLIAGRRSD